MSVKPAITIRIDEEGLDECLAMLHYVYGELRRENLPVEERFDTLMRLSGIFRANYGQVAFNYNEDWRTAGPAGTPLVVPKPSDALLERYATEGGRMKEQRAGMVPTESVVTGPQSVANPTPGAANLHETPMRCLIRYYPGRGEFILAQCDRAFNIVGVECAYCGMPRHQPFFFESQLIAALQTNDVQFGRLLESKKCVGCGSPVFVGRNK